MTRARGAWIAAGVVVVLAALGYLVRLRTRRRPVTTGPQAPLSVTAEPVTGMASSETAVAETWQRFEEAAAVRSDESDLMEREQPLATWVRVAIVVLALLAFFAVSLIATKQV